MNDYFYWPGHAGRVSDGVTARGAHVNNPLDELTLGLDKLPSEAQNNRGTRNYGIAGGAANAYTLALAHVATTYGGGQDVFLEIPAGLANTGPSTLNVSGIGAVAIVYPDNTAVAPGELPVGTIAHLKYSATLTKWIFLSMSIVGHNDAVAAAAAAVTVRTVTEGLYTGYASPYRIANPTNYGGIGFYAVDLSYSTGASTTKGATGDNSVALGYDTTASAFCSMSAGTGTIASGSRSVCTGSNCETSSDWGLGIGFSASPITPNGTNQNLTVLFDGQNGNGYFDGVADLAAADYAEYFETADGLTIEPGYFVAFDTGSNKIVPGNTDIVGIVSAAPAIVGDTASLHWQDKYLRDDFDRYIWQDVEVTNDDSTTEIMPDKVLNPDYDPALPYVPRSERPEWVPVGLLGKLWVRTDDVTIVVGDRIDAGVDGKAVKGTGWRVIDVRTGLVRVLYK